MIDEAASHPLLDGVKEAIEESGVKTLALFPVSFGERVRGVFSLRTGRPHERFGEREINFCRMVANSCAVAIMNARLVESLQDETQRLDRDRLHIEAELREGQAIEAELRKTKEFLEDLINSSIDAIVAADVKGNVIVFNRAAEVIYGYRVAEVIGKMSVVDFYPEGGAREVMRQLRSPQFGGKGKLEASRREIRAKSGELIPVDLSAAVIYEDGEEVATVGIFRDLREQLKIERKLEQMQEKLSQTEKQVILGELAGTAAHELNQPLTSVMGYAELVKRRIKEEDPNYRAISVILDEAERMARIVHKIGKITKYETKPYTAGSRIVDLEKSSKEGGGVDRAEIQTPPLEGGKGGHA